MELTEIVARPESRGRSASKSNDNNDGMFVDLACRVEQSQRHIIKSVTVSAKLLLV